VRGCFVNLYLTITHWAAASVFNQTHRTGAHSARIPDAGIPATARPEESRRLHWPRTRRWQVCEGLVLCWIDQLLIALVFAAFFSAARFPDMPGASWSQPHRDGGAAAGGRDDLIIPRPRPQTNAKPPACQPKPCICAVGPTARRSCAPNQPETWIDLMPSRWNTGARGFCGTK